MRSRPRPLPREFRPAVLLRFAAAALLFAPLPGLAAEDDGNGVRGDADAPVIAETDRLLARGWEENGVEPGREADDSEWLRRACLDLGGKIPTADEALSFRKERGEDKRAAKVRQLLDSSDYVSHFATVWTNLSVGQGEPDRTSRLGMRRFYREVFARNRPWNEVVYDLITAEGHFEENGATNFLLAQMVDEDEGVQATAKATRLLLGMQVQCTQCHNHPFNDWKQDQFWQFNSILREARRKDVREFNENTGQVDFKFAKLVRRPLDGQPVFFEKRSGLKQVAFPEVFGVKLGEEGDRRAEFAAAITGVSADPESEAGGAATVNDQIARAFVNRTWAHFHGYGFTRPVDDMGPHNPPSHPELLDYLSEQFVESGYDVRRLVTWITGSRAYHLTSAATRENAADDPGAGEVPLFSHMAVKRMTAEQLYDSLLVATDAASAAGADYEAVETQKREWLQQFVTAFGTDELTEATTFNGSIPQALMMMNGELTGAAVGGEPGSFLNRVLTEEGDPRSAVERLFVAALGRTPSRGELTAASRLVAGSESPLYGYQDLFWALLNSNEFIFVR